MEKNPAITAHSVINLVASTDVPSLDNWLIKLRNQSREAVDHVMDRLLNGASLERSPDDLDEVVAGATKIVRYNAFVLKRVSILRADKWPIQMGNNAITTEEFLVDLLQRLMVLSQEAAALKNHLTGDGYRVK